MKIECKGINRALCSKRSEELRLYGDDGLANRLLNYQKCTKLYQH